MQTSPKIRCKNLCDIEHSGDLQPHLDAIHQAGGRVVNTETNYDAENAEVYYTIPETLPWDTFNNEYIKLINKYYGIED